MRTQHMSSIINIELQTIHRFPRLRRRPLLMPSPGWKSLLGLSHLRHYSHQFNFLHSCKFVKWNLPKGRPWWPKGRPWWPKGKTLVTKRKTLVTKRKTLVTKGKTLVIKGKSCGRAEDILTTNIFIKKISEKNILPKIFLGMFFCKKYFWGFFFCKKNFWKNTFYFLEKKWGRSPPAARRA